MSSWSGWLDLAPADLDRLEDALEDLELSTAQGELSADDPVARRLAEYREILRLGRDAMPLEDVPAGLLDGVIAQAHQAAAAAPAAGPAAPSFWARWRLGVWVPALAFAGSAALLLVVLVPEAEDRAASGAATVVAQGEPRAKADSKADAKAADAQGAAEGRLAFAEPASSLAEGEALRGEGVVIGERAPEPAPTEEQVEQAAIPADDAEPDEAASLRRTSAGGGKKEEPTSSTSKAAGVEPAPKSPPAAGAPEKGNSAPKPDPLGTGDTGKDDEHKGKKTDTSDAWSELSRADADRRSGSCGLAKMRYDKLRKLDDARVRARALAGAGLCAAANDDMAMAKKLFDQARNADPGVSSFIDRELARLEDDRAANADDPSPKTGD